MVSSNSGCISTGSSQTICFNLSNASCLASSQIHLAPFLRRLLSGLVTYTPHDIPATPQTRIGRLEDLDIIENMPNEAEERLWTHGDDEEDEATVRDLIEAAEDPEEAFKQRLDCGSAYVEAIIDDELGESPALV